MVLKKRGYFLAGNASAAMARALATDEFEREVNVFLKFKLFPRTGAVTTPASSITSVAVGDGSTTIASLAVAELAMEVTISEPAINAAISPERTDLVELMGLPCLAPSVDRNSKDGELSPDLTVFRASYWTFQTFERESVHTKLFVPTPLLPDSALPLPKISDCSKEVNLAEIWPIGVTKPIFGVSRLP